MKKLALGCGATASLVAAFLATQSPSTASSTGSARSHTLDLRIKETAIYVTPGPAGEQGPPRLAQETGIVKGSLSGVNRTDVHVVAGNGTRRFYFKNGTMYGTFTFHGEQQQNGSPIIGTVKILSGTGDFAGAHGTLHIEGFHDDRTGYSTEHLTGSVSY